MAYGTLKCDNIVFDNGGTDKLLTVSGLFFSTSGALTVTGTISGGNVTAPTATFTTLTGTTTAGTIATFTSGSFTSLTGVTTTVTSGVFSLGSAAAPSITFSGDTNNGIYSPGADQVGISTNGTSRIVVDASGNVNIDSNTLYVDAANNRVGIVNSAPTSSLHVGAGVASTQSPVTYLSAENDSNAVACEIRQGRFDKDVLVVSSNQALSANLINAVDNGTSRFVVTGPGNVGINTTGPIAKLDIYKGAGGSYADALILTNDSANGPNQGIAFGSTVNISCRIKALDDGVYGTHLIFEGRTASGPLTTTTEYARINSSGKLLVGGSSDSGGALFQVFGDRIKIGTAKTPASATATGTAGEICWDANYIYVCTATNTWKRTAISTW